MKKPRYTEEESAFTPRPAEAGTPVEEVTMRQRIFDADLTRTYVECLLDLRDKTDPGLGAQSEIRKYHLASQALFAADPLFRDLTAWAVDRMIGVIKSGVGREALREGGGDRHEFERLGAAYEPGDTPLDRAVLADLIVRSGFIPEPFRAALQQGLRALNAGEATPFLTPAKTGRWRNPHTLADLRFRALLHVHFRWGAGLTKKAATEEVASAFGVSPATVRYWENTWLPSVLGEIKNRLTTAKQAGALKGELDTAEDWRHPDKFAQAVYLHLRSEPLHVLAARHRAAMRDG